MNIAQAIIHLYPDSKPLIDFIVQDDSDGNGAYIASWNLSDEQPSPSQLEQAYADFLALPIPEPEPSEVDIIGMQMVEKDLQILDLQGTLEALGAQVVDVDLRLLQGGM